MSDEYWDFGEFVQQNTLNNLYVMKTLSAIKSDPTFNFIECRTIEVKDQISEMLIVECIAHEVPSKNKVGIKYKERLALRFFIDNKKCPEVRALRKDFPSTSHQNDVSANEPASLCLHYQSWDEFRRTWTPQQFLLLIKNWLIQTSKSTLHQDDQPLESFFFEDSKIRLILPVDFDEKVSKDSYLMEVEVVQKYNDILTIKGNFIETNLRDANKPQPFHLEILYTEPVTHGRIEQIPKTLGELNTQFELRGSSFSNSLKDKIQKRVEGKGLKSSEKPLTLIILSIFLKRTSESKIEKVQSKGLIIHENLTVIGEKMGILDKNNQGIFYYIHEVVKSGKSFEEWKKITIEPLEILNPFTKDLARKMSGITSNGPKGILAGAGALGSSLHNIWIRQGWGEWTVVDPDMVNPHNLARHTTLAYFIGRNKANVLFQLNSLIFPDDVNIPKSFELDVLKFCESNSKELKETSLIVDVTTSINVPRELSAVKVCRTISAFITPNGLGSVLLSEDENRTIKLDSLEAQYYRSIINKNWGKDHLLGNKGKHWVGAGCRDFSFTISNDLIQLHSAILARHIRYSYESKKASINIWQCDKDTGSVESIRITPSEVLEVKTKGFIINWNISVRAKIREFRKQKLPKETGGILLGYIDQVLSKIFIVDILPCPSDSIQEESGFIRGKEGLEIIIGESQRRTSNIVSYIGEWHSHPDNSSVKASELDFNLLLHLAKGLNSEGLPAVMLIVGKKEESWHIK